MALVKGKFALQWGSNVIEDVEEIEVNSERSSDDYETVQQQTRRVYGSRLSDVGLTVLGNDIAVLAVLLPQYYVAQGEVLSTGETVTNEAGAIDVVPNCTDAPVYNDLDITSCGDPGETFRLVNAYTELESVEFDGKVRKVMVRFVGEPAADDASIQFFKESGINPIS